jgi:hypothetical protein
VRLKNECWNVFDVIELFDGLSLSVHAKKVASRVRDKVILSGRRRHWCGWVWWEVVGLIMVVCFVVLRYRVVILIMYSVGSWVFS